MAAKTIALHAVKRKLSRLGVTYRNNGNGHIGMKRKDRVGVFATVSGRRVKVRYIKQIQKQMASQKKNGIALSS